ncbi:unnamed protein product [Pelagomonas calceolata]|uniref:Uncharacterized protein n=1 Tax=Pelagomonas calceolata TaxID=35677 RepID=A0A8J2SRZ4_9STRA|nr:unnamed protein product [Pelagomonas calceolata]
MLDLIFDARDEDVADVYVEIYDAADAVDHGLPEGRSQRVDPPVGRLARVLVVDLDVEDESIPHDADALAGVGRGDFGEDVVLVGAGVAELVDGDRRDRGVVRRQDSVQIVHGRPVAVQVVHVPEGLQK